MAPLITPNQEFKAQIQELQNEIKPLKSSTTNLQQQHQQQQPGPPQKQQIPAAAPQAPAAKKGPKQNNSYTDAAGPSNQQNEATFTKVTHKKTPSAPLYSPDDTRMNRQLIIRTKGIHAKKATSEAILAMVNLYTAPQGVTFVGASIFNNGVIRRETNIHTSADQGSELHFQITKALDLMNIEATSVYANSRWSKWVIHYIPCDIGTTNTTEVATCLADEFFKVTEVSLA